MARETLPCIACGRKLYQIDGDASANQPYNGTEFMSHGHYGSTVYDPMDGHYLACNICDACIALHPERFEEGRSRKPMMEDGTVVGWEDVYWKPVAWHPKRTEVEYALKVALDESGDYETQYDLEAPEPGNAS